jgi:hypothetical protein
MGEVYDMVKKHLTPYGVKLFAKQAARWAVYDVNATSLNSIANAGEASKQQVRVNIFLFFYF